MDAEVGRHLFEKCICGILADKARILVTHQLQFLKSVGRIILLDSGNVQVQGTYTDLLSSGIDFAQLLNTDEDKAEAAAAGGSPTKRSSFARQRTISEGSVQSSISHLSHGRSGSLTVPGPEGKFLAVCVHTYFEIYFSYLR